MSWFQLGVQVFTFINTITRRMREMRLEGEHKDKFNAIVKEKMKKVEDEVIKELEDEFGPGSDGRFR